MVSKKDKGIQLIYFGIVIIIAAIYLGYLFFRKEALYKNPKISNANITEVNHGGTKGGSLVIKYYFLEKGKIYRGGIDCDLSYDISNAILNKRLPVVFDRTNPNNNVLLVDEKRWEKLKIPFPDSLLWLKRFYP